MSILSVSNLDHKAYAWASRPSSARPNEIIRITDIGPVDELFFYTGSRWAPINGTVVLASTNTSSSVTGTTSETELGSFIFPGGLMSANGFIEISSFWSVTNSANGKVIRIKFSETSDPVTSGTSFLSRTETSILYHQHLLIVRNVNSVSSQKCQPIALGTGFGVSTSSVNTASIDTSTDKKVYLAGTLNNTGETITLRGYRATYRE